MAIRLDTPLDFDLVGSRVLIGAIGTGFEATITYRIHPGQVLRVPIGEDPAG